MQSFYTLAAALAYIEENLRGDITPGTVAAHCLCSLSALQKLFRFALHLGVMEYAQRRRLTQAARDLQGGASVLETALRYGYASPEVFTRAFRRFWGITPTTYRRTWRFAGLFPMVEAIEQEGNGIMRRQFDLTELYETLKARAGVYVLSFDMRGLMGINAISRDLGDAAIREALHRIDAVATGDMPAFRIGGDEFVLVSDLTDRDAVEALANRVLALNGQTVSEGGHTCPVFLWAAAMRIPEGSLRYGELYTRLASIIQRGEVHENKLYFAD